MTMLLRVLVSVIIFSLEVFGQSCKDPLVAKRLLADDVRYASPFYVIALPRSSQTEEMDNVCYSYFENGEKFFHLMSITYKNGSNVFYTYYKGDLSNRMGLAEGSGVDSRCVYHDYTLIPICNSTVFVLYRCFKEGDCDHNIDIGVTPGVDVRIVLAASPIVDQECHRETDAHLKETSNLLGNDYVLLPQKLKPQCITRYNGIDSVGANRAQGSKQVNNQELADRFGIRDNSVEVNQQANSPVTPQVKPQVKPQVMPLVSSQVTPPYAAPYDPSTSKTTYNPYVSSVKTPGTRPSGSASTTWSTQGNQGTPMNQYNSQTHHHVWGPQVQTTTTHGANPNVLYHVHSWSSQSATSGCCKCY